MDEQTETSEPQVVKSLLYVKEITVSVMFLATVFVGVIFSWVQLRDQLSGIATGLERVQQVQRFQMMNDDHQEKVLEHIAQKSGVTLPPKPRELEAAERRLIQ